MATGPYWGEDLMIANHEMPDILALGDSWFWYPFNNLLNPVFNIWNGHYVILALGGNGYNATDYVKPPVKKQYADSLAYWKSIKVILLSGGGNDISGMEDFSALIKPDCSKAKSYRACFRAGQPKQILDTIAAAYRELITLARAKAPHAAIAMHNYDYAIPTGVGFLGFGHWLKDPMDQARVPDAFRQQIVNYLIDGLGARFADLARRNRNVKWVNTTGVLAANDWANEMHPVPGGYNKIVTQRFAPVLKQYLNW